MKYKLIIAFEADSFQPLVIDKITDIVLLNENNKKIKPTHSFEFQDLVDDISQWNIERITYEKYNDYLEKII